MGGACEMLVAAELTLAGIPALKVPDGWPGYDVIAQPLDVAPQRISVKSRTFKRGAAFVTYSALDLFDWLAIVLLPGDGFPTRRLFLVPRAIADEAARTYSAEIGERPGVPDRRGRSQVRRLRAQLYDGVQSTGSGT